jgi:NTE family protein
MTNPKDDIISRLSQWQAAFEKLVEKLHLESLTGAPRKPLAFVLAGGGSWGALQVGALRALFEKGYQPDLLVGTSIGAVNAAFLAIHGFSEGGLEKLAQAWREAVEADLLPVNYLWFAVRAMFGRSLHDPSQNIRNFMVRHGVNPELRFVDLQGPRLVIISSDLNTGKPVLHGLEEGGPVLEALLLSTALPPWVLPKRKEDRYLMDGGVVSNLPVQPALAAGAAQIVALDLVDNLAVTGEALNVGVFFQRLVTAMEKRQLDLELALAEAHRVPMLYIGLQAEPPVPIWNFSYSETLLEQGYETARRVLEGKP